MDSRMVFEAMEQPVPLPAVGIFFGAVLACVVIVKLHNPKANYVQLYTAGGLVMGVMFVLFTVVQVVRFQLGG